MSVSKMVQVTIQDHTGKALGTVMATPKSSMWRATGRPPWIHCCRINLKTYIVGKGREATLHLLLPRGEPAPRKMVPLREGRP